MLAEPVIRPTRRSRRAFLALPALLIAALAIVAVSTVAASTAANAQATTLTLAGWPLAVTSTNGADFEAGAVSLGSTSFIVDATTSGPTRITAVQVQCSGGCPTSGTLGVTGLQWRRDDQATWTQLATAYVTIESRSVTFNGANDPWSRTILWRYVLGWTTHPPTAATQFRVRFRLVVTSP